MIYPQLSANLAEDIRSPRLINFNEWARCVPQNRSVEW